MWSNLFKSFCLTKSYISSAVLYLHLRCSCFRQKYLKINSCAVSLLNDIWVRVEHSLLQKLNLQKKSIAVQAVCGQVVYKIVRTSWTLAFKTASNILYYEKNYNEYLYISDPIFTMLLAPERKVILDFFSDHKVICLCVEFEIYPTPATGF